MCSKNYRFLTPLFFVLACTQAGAQTASPVPRLVVNVVVDQLRTDYLEAFSDLYGADGFNRLLRDGRTYLQAEYPFRDVDRASAMACIMSGSTPYENGIVAESWMDRKTLRPVYCVDDNRYRGWLASEGYSPVALQVSTITDELKMATDGRALVYSIAPEADAAILSAGHAADCAFWLNDSTGYWSSTSYYGDYPEWALRYDSSSPLSERISGFVWKPVSSIVGNFNYFISNDDKRTFKHKFEGDRRVIEFKTSAFVNEEVNRFAEHCFDNTELGKDQVTDFLTLTYYAGNFDHKPISDCPVELQDTYVRLDGEISRLIKLLESHVGAGRFLLVLTSTGYMDDEFTNLEKYKIPTGEFSITRASALLNMYLMAIYGQGKYVEAEYGTQLFLNQKLIEEKQLNMSDVLTRSSAFLMQMAGVKDVYTSQRLALGAWTSGVSRIRNSFNINRSGDIYIEVSPGWKYVNEQTGEQDFIRASYVGFPVFFFGCNVRPETVKTPVSVDCIAPTLASFMRIRAPNACSTAPLSAIR